jgi:hypothetical protein
MSPDVIFEKVLLVEDEGAHAMLVERALKPFVREVVKCESVAQAKA